MRKKRRICDVLRNREETLFLQTFRQVDLMQQEHKCEWKRLARGKESFQRPVYVGYTEYGLLINAALRQASMIIYLDEVGRGGRCHASS